MSWWQNWRYAFEHPADNVVAAVVVLLGVAVTAATTLLVGGANRRHERLKESRGRLFDKQAKAYTDASIYLAVLEREDGKREVEQEDLDRLIELTTQLGLYATPRATERFYEAAIAALDMDRSKPKAEFERSSVVASDLRSDFINIVRADVQGTRARPLWLRRLRRRLRRAVSAVESWAIGRRRAWGKEV